MKKSKRIAILALMLSLIIIFNFVPISIGTVTLGLMIIPVLIVAQVSDFKMTLACSLFLGITNLIGWYTVKAGSLMAPVFQNPLVCILPRLLIGVVAYWSRIGMEKLFRKQIIVDETIDNRELIVKRKRISIATSQGISIVSTALGVITNTLFVGLMVVLLFNGKSFGATAITPKYILVVFGLNFLIEVIAFPLLVPPIAYAIKKIR